MHRVEVRAWNRPVEKDAHRAVLILWLELASLAQSTRRAGFIPSEHLECQFGLHSKDVLAAASGAVPLLKAVDGGFFCQLFAELNPHLDARSMHPQGKGGMTAGVNRQMRVAQDIAMKELPLIPVDRILDEAGRAIPPSALRDARALVINLDRVLGGVVRAGHTLPPGLLATAARVAVSSAEAGVRSVLVWLSFLRQSGASELPASAEAALEKWPELVAAAERNGVP